MDIPQIELRLLRYFIAVADTEHVGRAAEQLHVSQSPLSRQIKQLEELLGVALFRRDGRRIRLTPAGRALRTPARDLLVRADALVRDARAGIAASPTRIAVGFVNTALATGLLPAALRVLRARHPDVRIELKHATTETQLALVTAGELDVALIHSVPPAPHTSRAADPGPGRIASLVRRGDLEIVQLLEQPYRLAALRDGPYGRMALAPAKLADAPWISIGGPSRARDAWRDACAAVGFAPQIAVEVSDYASALALVEAGVGVALLPASQAAMAPAGVVLRPLGWLRLTSQLWAASRRTSAPASTLADELVRALTAQRVGSRRHPTC